MKMIIVSPLKMQWEEKFKETFPEAFWSKVPLVGYDNYLFMWCDQATQDFINNNPKQGKYTVYIRRYEYYSNLEAVQWDKVDEVIMVNDYFAQGFEKRTGRKAHVIYNAVDPSRWTFKERAHGNKIAMVGFINQKKNYPLALQIMAELPKEYELHIAGDVQDGATVDYILNLGNAMGVTVKHYGHVPHEHMDEWLDDKNYILSTAISEGCPNHVIEAMAKGIKPIVHNWPGAKEQFKNLVFNTSKEAVDMTIQSSYEIENDYFSIDYRTKISEKFGLSNYQKVRDIVCAQR